jgi:Methylamine utilisation protein MauE
MPSSSSTTEILDFFQASGCFLLSGVFLVAGVAKLTDRRKTTAGFGSLASVGAFPKSIVKPLSIAVPLVELALGVGLLLRLTAAAIAAALLLVGFTVTLQRALRMSTESSTAHPVTCNCFGALSTDALTTVSVARNVLLIAVAIAVAAIAVFQADAPSTATGLLFPALLSAGLLALVGSFGLSLANMRQSVGGIFSAQPSAS